MFKNLSILTFLVAFSLLSTGCDQSVGIGEGTCSDGLLNQNEEDVDCGGVCKVCPDPDLETCFDGRQNQDEEDIDCGGTSCPACPTCFDERRNRDEDDVDCGGNFCPPCAPQGPTCTDGIQNGDETGVDCGGPACLTCPDPTCDDGELNQQETLIDCGGPNCPPCSSCQNGIQDGRETGIDCGGDCEPCQSGEPSCFDQLLNGNERGVDCGGSCAQSCTLEQDDVCLLSDDECPDTSSEDLSCSYVAELDIGGTTGLCRERCEDISDCDPGYRCVETYNTGSSYLVSRHPTLTYTGEQKFCIREPAANSQWEINIDFVSLDQEHNWGDTPDIMVCFGPPVEEGYEPSNTECILDEEQYASYTGENIGSIIFNYSELERIGVIVMDDDGFTGYNFGSVDDRAAEATFDLRPAGNVRSFSSQVLYGQGDSFGAGNVGLAQIQLSIRPVE